jgi:DNA end-binding protein Ku
MGRGERNHWVSRIVATRQSLNPHAAWSGAETGMPRATWKGFLRLSLVSCPVYLVPASTRTKSIRLHQVWVRGLAQNSEPDVDDEEVERPIARGDRRFQPALPTAYEDRPSVAEAPDYTEPATRISLRPVDRDTGVEIERDAVVKGYEYERGHFMTFTPDELKALEVESTHTIDLTLFVPRAEVDPLYFNAPYYVYPDGPLAAEAFGVIGKAMAKSGMAGLGRVTIARRERTVFVEPRDGGMVLITLRSAQEMRPAQFGALGEIDPEMVAAAETIIQRRTGSFDPATFRDRYQDALRELIEAKRKGLPVQPKPTAAPAPVVDLMAAPKRSLQQETAARAPTKLRGRKPGDRRQATLLLPFAGGASRPTPNDSVIGLAPGVGDAALALISLYFVYEAVRLRLPRYKIARMVWNVVVEAVLGALPVLGDFFDVVWKANLRNVDIIDRHFGMLPR